MSGPGRGHHTPRGLRQQLREWFAANPSEFLTAEDTAAKFSITVAKAKTALKGLREEGTIFNASMYGLDTERML